MLVAVRLRIKNISAIFSHKFQCIALLVPFALTDDPHVLWFRISLKQYFLI